MNWRRFGGRDEFRDVESEHLVVSESNPTKMRLNQKTEYVNFTTGKFRDTAGFWQGWIQGSNYMIYDMI